MSKADFSVARVEKNDCAELLIKYHYLSNVEGNKGFKSGFNYGLIRDGEVVGACIYTGFPVPELVKGCFGLDRKDQRGMFELSRLVLGPKFQSQEHNLASWFVSQTLRALVKDTQVRAVLSYADNTFHSGTVYAASNFTYYGLSAKKSDFWVRRSDGSYEKHKRGRVKGLEGEWRPRTQKHRFLRIYDKSLNVLWMAEKWQSCGAW